MPTPLSRTKWISRITIMSLFIITVCLYVSAFQAGAATSPRDVIKTGTDNVLRLLKEHSGDATSRREGIRRVVDDHFDFEMMGRRALGPHWKEQPPEKQREFTQAFSQFLFNRYINEIEKYTNEKLTYTEKEIKGNYALVEALITGGKHDSVSLVYHLRLKDGTWKVYDVVIEGVGLVSNYRGQFDSILSKDSFDSLIKRLREKNALKE